MSADEGWSYTEKLLNTLDHFQTPDGFRVQSLGLVEKP
jgi:hypothetical protein